MPAGSMAPWTIDTTVARTGSASYKSGAVTHYQYTSTRFRGVFATGTLRFYARVESDSCCDYLQVLVNGVVASSTSATQQWVQVSVPIASGLRDVEFRYQKDHYSYQSGNAAWIDDVTFAP
jgi:pseudolysin